MEDNRKLAGYKQQIKNAKVKNINNPTPKAVEKYEEIYNNLTEGERGKWNEYVTKAQEKYYTMMNDLGYENMEKNFAFLNHT